MDHSSHPDHCILLEVLWSHCGHESQYVEHCSVACPQVEAHREETRQWLIGGFIHEPTIDTLIVEHRTNHDLCLTIWTQHKILEGSCLQCLRVAMPDVSFIDQALQRRRHALTPAAIQQRIRSFQFVMAVEQCQARLRRRRRWAANLAARRMQEARENIPPEHRVIVFDRGGTDCETILLVREFSESFLNDECAICRQGFSRDKSEEDSEGICKLNISDCRHIWHIECIRPWIETADNCPKCRRRIPRKLIRKPQSFNREEDTLLEPLA